MGQGSDMVLATLYESWDLSELPKTSIRWVDLRKDMGPFLAGDLEISETVCIGVYDNRTPKRRTSFRGKWRYQNCLTIDVSVRTIDGARTEQEADSLRTQIVDEIDRILKASSLAVFPDHQDCAETDLYYRKVMVFNVMTYSEVT